MNGVNRWNGERTGISFPPGERELYERARIKAFKERRTLSAVVRELLKSYVEGESGANPDVARANRN